MAAYLLTWNPRRFNSWDSLFRLAKTKFSSWSCGARLHMGKGSRIYLFRQGAEPRGIVASGYIAKDVYQDEHWDEERRRKGQEANYVDVSFDVVLKDDAFPAHQIKRLGAVNWRTQMSGIEIPTGATAELERLWMRFAKLEQQAELKREVTAMENTLTEVTTYVRGRDRNLRERALAHAKGICSACEYDFGQFLQGLGRRVLQVHHRRQLAASDTPRINGVKDLAVVCANCHAMLHADAKRAMSVETLRRRLRAV
jgi:5-methylcytosine-specific restriction protein A